MSADVVNGRHLKSNMEGLGEIPVSFLLFSSPKGLDEFKFYEKFFAYFGYYDTSKGNHLDSF